MVVGLLAIGGVEAACGDGRQSTSGISLTRIEDSQQRARMALFPNHYGNAQILAPPR